MAEFFDSLAAVCAPEIAAALKNKDADRAARLGAKDWTSELVGVRA